MLQEIFAQCKEQIEDETNAIRSFIIKAKVQKPEVTMDEIKETVGFGSEIPEGADEEDIARIKNKDANRWNTTILKPIKKAILKKMSPESSYDEVFSRSPSEGSRKLKDKIKSLLPKSAKRGRTKTEETFDYLQEDVDALFQEQME